MPSMDVCLQICAFGLSLFLFPVAFGCTDDNGRTLEFPGPFSFISKRLVNHTIGTKIVADFENCKLHCYYEHNCVSVNYHVSTKTCELNNATHRWHNNEFKDENGYLYHGADNACEEFDCLNGGTCQSGFTVERYRCLCPPGFRGKRCQADIDECRFNSHNCSNNAICINTKGSFNCSCKPGYSGNGHNCSDIDECNAANNSCHENAWCNNTQGSFTCSCKPGYEGDGYNCTDADECLNNSHNCSENATCTNIEGSFNCSCKPGYIGNGHNCSEFSINSTILHGNQYYLRHLHRFLASAPEVGEDSSWLLCYSATSHGWKAKIFHDRCDGKRNTVTIIQKHQYVFGGYTDIPWGKI
ncbi:hypothetical protein ABFA07_023096 [Porites harrisoni]